MNPTRTTDVVVIGGGQAGLAMSQCLTSRSIDHVVLERGDTANSWRTERWDSLRLLTPNWLARLPGWSYQGDDPDGYMSASGGRRLPRRLPGVDQRPDPHRYRGHSHHAARAADTSSRPTTDHGPLARSSWRPVRAATRTSRRSPATCPTTSSTSRRSGTGIPRNSATAVSSWSGRRRPGSRSPMNSAAPAATSRWPSATTSDCRAPTAAWTSTGGWTPIGQLDERYDEVDDLDRARRLPSLQLIGSPERRDLDLTTVAANGVTLAGRLVGRSGHRAQFSGSFANMCTSADLKQRRLLDRLDEYATSHGLDAELGEATRPSADRSRRRRCSRPTCARSTPSSGQPASDRPTRGSTRDCSTARVASSTTEASCPFPASTSSVCRSCDGASRASSTASAPTQQT